MQYLLTEVGFSTGLGVARSLPDEGDTAFYARSVALCWINRLYVPTYGFGLQNLWITISIGGTLVCYAWILVSLIRNKQSSRQMQPRKKNAPPEPSGHHPAFLVYPAVYILCSGLITLVGLLASAGVRVNVTYFSLVSIISSSAGLLDAILWSTTILFSSSRDLEEIGLAKYGMRTPQRTYGNMVWVEGATRERSSGRKLTERRWWRLTGSDSQSPGASRDGLHNEDDNIIRMDTVTTVMVDSADPSKPPLHYDGSGR